MDAAAAAAMSDPDRNTYFRRRWLEASAVQPDSAPPCTGGDIGTFGLALLEALRRRDSGAGHSVQDGGGSR